MSSAPENRDDAFMKRALELGERGLGRVEPNPMVGCVIVRGEEIVGEGWHRQFGGPHAEIEALQAAGAKARDAAVYVTLEPCCHQGKTGPCTEALIEAGVARVVVGCKDPNPQVAGNGITSLQNAGIEVVESAKAVEAQDLIAPFAKLMSTNRPWVIAKWAMTLDGKIATSNGSSQWISSEQSRARVHQLRGRVDGILAGRGTIEADDPLLTARPPGFRVATRIVLDSEASLNADSKLIQSLDVAPLLVAVSESAPMNRRQRLEGAGAEVFTCVGKDRPTRLESLLDELGRRQVTNLLVEGGAEVLGTLFEIQAIDEVLAFVAPKLIGDGIGPMVGQGFDEMADALRLTRVKYEILEDDICLSGQVMRDSS